METKTEEEQKKSLLGKLKKAMKKTEKLQKQYEQMKDKLSPEERKRLSQFFE